jgi:hypothetical protein
MAKKPWAKPTKADHYILRGTGEMYRLEIQLAELPPMNTSAFGHWRTRHAATKDIRDRMRLLLLGYRPAAPLLFSRVRMMRGSCAIPDAENLSSAFKPYLDALMVSTVKTVKGKVTVQNRAHIIKDDSPDHVVREYRWEHARPGYGFIRIVVEELP